MTEKRKSIVIHQKWFDLMILVLEPHQSIEILKLIQAKYNDEEYECTDKVVNAYWFMMEDVVQSAKEKYDKRVEANRKNGKKGGAPKGNSNASKTTETTQINPNNLKNKNMNTYSYQNMVVLEETSLDDVPSSQLIETL